MQIEQPFEKIYKSYRTIIKLVNIKMNTYIQQQFKPKCAFFPKMRIEIIRETYKFPYKFKSNCKYENKFLTHYQNPQSPKCIYL